MELSASVARLLMVGLAGSRLDDDLKRLIERGVSGVVLFSRNIESLEQVAHLCSSIKDFAGPRMLLAVDQEGGAVQRIRHGMTRFPAMRTLGRTKDPDLAREVGRVLGTELRAVGVDMNFAPVLDVDTNPENPVIRSRALSSDPSLVSELGVALGRGLEGAGVASCGKHFPGHGDTVLDSHLALPRITSERGRLEAVEFRPFRAWAEAQLASVMTAHVVFDALEPRCPATLSKRALSGLLREELGYQGVIVSDDLNMAAIIEHFGLEQAAIQGLEAGVDCLLIGRGTERCHRVIDAIIDAVTRGRLDEHRVDEAGARLDRLAGRFARRGPPQLERVGKAQHLLDRLFAAGGDSSSDREVDPTSALGEG